MTERVTSIRVKISTLVILVMTIVPGGLKAEAVGPNGHEKYVLYSDEVREMLPPEIADFTERYFYDRINSDKTPEEARRKMNFDEVVCSFPLQKSSIERLKTADGLSMLLDRGRKYTIKWLKGEDIIGEMTFPASYNLIQFTDKEKSVANLIKSLASLTQEEGTQRPKTVGITPRSKTSTIRREGIEFYLRHLTSDTYLDSITGRPVWGPDHVGESLANLFVGDYAVADIDLELEVKTYGGENIQMRVPIHVIRKLMDEANCSPYFNVSEIDEENGVFEALAVYHNSVMAYLHKLEVKLSDVDQWREGGQPTITIKMMPYIKLHTLKNLWGDKKFD